ncbi:MAG: hypothetical protein KAQ83_04440 [Nanoarchaeota archaeon]|nr:hypothetical protein [Nanoarchaeota archaeon]
MIHKKLYEILGWYGITAVLVAYSLITLKVLLSHSIIYLFLNLTGAAGILIHSYIKKDYQPVVLNIIWIVIALLGLIQLLL